MLGAATKKYLVYPDQWKYQSHRTRSHVRSVNVVIVYMVHSTIQPRSLPHRAEASRVSGLTSGPIPGPKIREIEHMQ